MKKVNGSGENRVACALHNMEGIKRISIPEIREGSSKARAEE